MKKYFNYIIAFVFIILVIFACEESNNGYYSDSADGSGKGGSMARFTIASNRLYAVDAYSLRTFDITDESSPEYSDSVYLATDIETIFPFNNTLFVGSQNGMFIYDISSPDNPIKMSQYEHITSCDPVVTDGEYAYVTLNSLNSWCGNWVNELHIVNVKNLYSPYLVKSYEMSNPRGLAVTGDYLYVCDNGLKIFDKSDVYNLEQIAHFNNIVAYDVIADEDRILVVGETGFYQYQFDGTKLQLLSEIKVNS